MTTPTPIHPNKSTTESVKVLSGLGATPEFIGEELGLPLAVLHKHYAKAMAHGPQEANFRVAQTFLHMATSGEYPQMTLAWMKMRAGWADIPPPQNEAEEEAETEVARQRLAALLKNRPDVIEKLR